MATPDGLTLRHQQQGRRVRVPVRRDLEIFEIDYLKKELKVKKKGGTKWNFTDQSDNAASPSSSTAT